MTDAPSITEQQLETLIPAFYERVRADAEIGPLFNSAVHDWPEHLHKLVAFWSSVMLTSGRYKGSPMQAHLMHRDAMTPQMFDRWLAIWGEVTDAQLPRPIAEALQAKAARIAESLQLALFFRLDPARSATA